LSSLQQHTAKVHCNNTLSHCATTLLRIQLRQAKKLIASVFGCARAPHARAVALVSRFQRPRVAALCAPRTEYVAVCCCRLLWCVAVCCCSVLQCVVAVCEWVCIRALLCCVNECVVVCCSAVCPEKCVAVCSCSVLQCVVAVCEWVCCRVL